MNWRQMTAAARALLSRIELRDLAFVAGVAAIVVGGFQISRPWTLVTVGAFLVLVAVAPWRRPS
jgi:hypothetical protein